MFLLIKITPLRWDESIIGRKRGVFKRRTVLPMLFRGTDEKGLRGETQHRLMLSPLANSPLGSRICAMPLTGSRAAEALAVGDPGLQADHSPTRLSRNVSSEETARSAPKEQTPPAPPHPRKEAVNPAAARVSGGTKSLRAFRAKFPEFSRDKPNSGEFCIHPY